MSPAWPPDQMKGPSRSARRAPVWPSCRHAPTYGVVRTKAVVVTTRLSPMALVLCGEMQALVVVSLALECFEKRFCLCTVVEVPGVPHVVQGRLGDKLKRLCIGCPVRCGIWPHRRYIPTHANKPSFKGKANKACLKVPLHALAEGHKVLTARLRR